MNTKQNVTIITPSELSLKPCSSILSGGEKMISLSTLYEVTSLYFRGGQGLRCLSTYQQHSLECRLFDHSFEIVLKSRRKHLHENQRHHSKGFRNQRSFEKSYLDDDDEIGMERTENKQEWPLKDLQKQWSSITLSSISFHFSPFIKENKE